MKLSLLFPAAAFAGVLAFTACAGKSQVPTVTAAAATTPLPLDGTTPPSAAGPAAPAFPVSPPPAPSSFKETAKADPATVSPYPFTTCAVIRKDLKGSPKYRRVYQNQEVIFCCTPCLRAFDSNPEPYMPRIFEAAAAKARGETVNSGW